MQVNRENNCQTTRHTQLVSSRLIVPRSARLLSSLGVAQLFTPCLEYIYTKKCLIGNLLHIFGNSFMAVACTQPHNQKR